MNLSVGTAIFYFRPFHEALEIIFKAGFDSIEFDLYWKGGRFEMAQHLKQFSHTKAIKLVKDFGLEIVSIHEGGGLVSNSEFINPDLNRFLEELNAPPKCIVFHTPSIEGKPDYNWWINFKDNYINTLREYQKKCDLITIENMPNIEGYFYPVNTPDDLKLFTESNNFGITLDTTHFAENGVDPSIAARILKNQIRTIHLSDSTEKSRHVFIGDGDINWKEFFTELKHIKLHTLTLECSMTKSDLSDMKMNKRQLISRLKLAKKRLENFL